MYMHVPMFIQCVNFVYGVAGLVCGGRVRLLLDNSSDKQPIVQFYLS